jgi:hypothetical protein
MFLRAGWSTPQHKGIAAVAVSSPIQMFEDVKVPVAGHRGSATRYARSVRVLVTLFCVFGISIILQQFFSFAVFTRY